MNPSQYFVNRKNAENSFLPALAAALLLYVSAVLESGWNRLLDEVTERRVSRIIIAHKDRLIRFGCDWFERLCEKFGYEIIVVNNDRCSPEKELIEDTVSILPVFSCRLYGLRKYSKIRHFLVLRRKRVTEPVQTENELRIKQWKTRECV